MEVEKVKKYIGEKVLIVLRNNFKITCIIPNFSGTSFETTDKFRERVTIECAMISFIHKQNSGGENGS